MFGGGDDESTTSIVRVGEGSSAGMRSLRGSIANRSGRSGSTSGMSSLRNKLSKGL